MFRLMEAVLMKIIRRNTYFNIWLIFAVIALEIYIKDNALEIPVHVEKITSLVEHKGEYTGQDVCDLERAPAVVYQEIDENFRQCHGRRQRKICGGLSAFYLTLAGHFTRFQCYFVNTSHRQSNGEAYCKSIIIRYIHNQDGRPPGEIGIHNVTGLIF